MQSHMRRGAFGAQRIKTADSSKKILVSWATGPKAASANQKGAAYKRPKIKRAGNAQREHKVYPHSALAVFPYGPSYARR
jgi:predicted RNase H-like nuclease